MLRRQRVGQRNVKTYLEPSNATARARVSARAVAHNLAVLRAHAPAAKHMAILKANAYGHGILPMARAVVDAGADALGAAQIREALALREAHPGIPVFTWLPGPRDETVEALALGVEVSASTREHLDYFARLAHAAGRRARVHLKVNTGMYRMGATAADTPDFIAYAAKLVRAGAIEVVGIWSHLACADERDNPQTAVQVQRFAGACEMAREAGLRGLRRHLANTAGVLWHPDTHLDMVRTGIGLYGLSPDSPATRGTDLGLRPAMTVSASVLGVREVAAGTGVSYDHTYVTPRDTRLAVIGIGYGDGVSRLASGKALVLVGGRLCTIAGRVCMDQIIVDVGADNPVRIGDEAHLFGDPAATPGIACADEWAAQTSTIGYEVVTRLARTLERRYEEATDAQ